MSSWLTCPLGHVWQADAAAPPLPPIAVDTCPTCGMTGETLPAEEIGSRTVDPSASASPASAPGSNGSNPESPPPTTPPPAPAYRYSVPGYEILSELGRGAMGVVYKARQEDLQRIVALKMVLMGAHAGEEGLARFLTEARAVAQLHHPNIVNIFTTGHQDGIPYFSMEYVGGGSLSQILRRDGPWPAERAAALIEVLGRAVHAVHQHGILHRDLKPANVLFTLEGTPKIADFGLAKRTDVDVNQTASGVVLGTPAYMAPEQARDAARVDTRGDIYSLGVLLYETLTGKPPFRGASPLEILDQVRFNEPEPPSRLVPGLPRDLEAICLKCLAKDPNQRYASAEALADDLHRFLVGEPIGAAPRSKWRRSLDWLRGFWGGSGKGPDSPRPASPRTFPSPVVPAAKADRPRTSPDSMAPGREGVSSPTQPYHPLVAAPADRVCFTVTSRPVVRPGTAFTIDLWTHLDRQHESIFRRSQIEFGGSEIQILKSKGPVRLAPGTRVSVRLTLETLIVEEAEDVLDWSGDLVNTCFRVKVPDGIAEGTVSGLATLHTGGDQIAKVPFVLEVGHRASLLAPALALQDKKRRVFVSYADEDRDAVLHCIQGMQKVAPHLEFFMDVVSLRSGQNWEEELRTGILTCDDFFLFWSDNARKSAWVEKEWRFALEARGLNFINPIPLVSPDEVPAPPELESKHFRDWVLPFLRKKPANTSDSLFLNVFKHLLMKKPQG